MKSNAPWSVKGIERDARETAKDAARREGMTVGEWLNRMIYTTGDPETGVTGTVDGLALTDLIKAIEHMNNRIAETEAQSANAVSDLSRNVGNIVERVQRIERVKPETGSAENLEARIGVLEEKSGDKQRINALKALEKAVGQVALQFDSSHKNALARIETNERQLQEFATRLDTVGGGDGSAVDGFAHLQDAIEGISARVARAERIATEAQNIRDASEASVDPEFIESTGQRLRVLGDEIKRGGDQIRSLEQMIAKLSGQIDAAEERSSKGVEKVTETITDLRSQFAGIDASDAEKTRQEIEAAVQSANAQSSTEIADIKSSLETLAMKLASAPVATAAQSLVSEVDASDQDISDLAEGLFEEEPAAEVADAEIDEPDLHSEIEALADAFDVDDPEVEAVTDSAADALDEIEEEPSLEISLDDFDVSDDEETETQSIGEDDLSFDLDEDDKVDEDASTDILSQVRAAFGGDGDEQVDTEEKTSESAAEMPEDDLDALLAELDAPETDIAPPPLVGDGSNANQSGDDEAAIVSAEASDEDDEPRDYLKAARKAAKESIARNEEEEESKSGAKRRKLTPKQKAILLARARKKRAAALAADGPIAISKEVSPEPRATLDDEEETTTGFIAKISGALSGVKSRLPFIGAKGDMDREEEGDVKTEPSLKTADDNEAQTGEEDRASERDILSNMKSGGIKPLTIALGAAILLAVAALLFLVKDIFAGSDAPRPEVVVSTPATDPGTDTPGAVEVPAAPTVNPRDLYFASVEKLGAATGADDADEAIQGLQQAAALGHPPAQLQLGELYKNGEGVEADLTQARSWYRRSANGGNALAMHRLGVMLAKGEGGVADPLAAINWFEQAATLGLVDSQYNLGAIYHPVGDGQASSVQDAAKAYFWYSLAADNGDQQAGSLAAGVAETLTGAEKTQIDADIAAWAPAPINAEANELAPSGA